MEMKTLSEKDKEEISQPYRSNWSRVKDLISDLLGLGIMIGSSIMVLCREIFIWPDWCIAMLVGGVLFFIPDGQISRGLKGFIAKRFQ